MYYNHFKDLFAEPETCEHIMTRFYGEDNTISSSSDDSQWITQKMEGKKILNHNNAGLTRRLMEYLNRQFPDKSMYEFDFPEVNFEQSQRPKFCC
jgi:hypothetical protein